MAGVKDVKVTVYDAGAPRKTRVDLRLQGTKIRDVKYGGKDVDTKAADARQRAKA